MLFSQPSAKQSIFVLSTNFVPNWSKVALSVRWGGSRRKKNTQKRWDLPAFDEGRQKKRREKKKESQQHIFQGTMATEHSKKKLSLMRTAGRERLITGETICYSFGKGCGDWLRARTHTPFLYLAHTQTPDVSHSLCEAAVRNRLLSGLSRPPQPEDAATAVAASRCRDYGLSDAAATSPARPLKCRHSDAMSARQAVGGCFRFPPIYLFHLSAIFPSSSLNWGNSIGNQQGGSSNQRSVYLRPQYSRFLSLPAVGKQPWQTQSLSEHSGTVSDRDTTVVAGWGRGRFCAQRFCKAWQRARGRRSFVANLKENSWCRPRSKYWCLLADRKSWYLSFVLFFCFVLFFYFQLI